jgi:hypothetical protein
LRSQDDEDDKEAAVEKEKFEAIKAKIEEETERARKRAERFGQEPSEPNVELILDSEELRLYYKITRPEKLAPKRERTQYRSSVHALGPSPLHLRARGPSLPVCLSSGRPRPFPAYSIPSSLLLLPLTLHFLRSELMAGSWMVRAKSETANTHSGCWKRLLRHNWLHVRVLSASASSMLR